MGVTFNGSGKLIICDAGTTSLDMKDVYSRWKQWVITSDNAKYPEAFSAIGGDSLVGGKFLGTTYFLENGWKIRPQEANHTLSVTGNLYSRDGSSPFVSTLGSFNVRIEMQVSNLVDQVATTGAAFDVNDIWAFPLEGTFTAQEVLRLMASALAGKLSGAGSGVVTIRDINDTKDRIVANVDSNGNRSTVNVNAT